MSKGDTPSEAGASGDIRLSRASVGRYSLYLRHLERFLLEGEPTVSSSRLGEALGITDAQVRKDLALLGHLGQPGIGYPTLELSDALRQRLGVDRTWSAVVVGIGNLARALLRYKGFGRQGFRFVGLFDTAADKLGTQVEGLTVRPLTDLAQVVLQQQAELGVLAVPAEAAQSVADALVAAGIRGILNFAPVLLRVPPGIQVVAVDLAVQLEQLAFLVHLNQEGPKTQTRPAS